MLDLRTGINIEPSRDDLLTPFSSKLLKEHYLREGESPQEGYARACKAWSGGDDALAQRLYDGVSQRWFMFASPVLSNAPLPGEKIKGMPISCFLTYVGDSLEQLMDHSTELRWLSVLGGGVGGHWGDVRSVSNKAPGPVPFIHTVDADMEAYSQGQTRRGSYAAYLDVSHPDIMEFISLRKVGGDASRKCMSKGFHHGVNITDAFMEAVEQDSDWSLIDPHDKSVRGAMRARVIWQEILETRYRTGEPYLYFIDTARRYMPESQKRLGLDLFGSNLCSEITLVTGPGRTAVCCLSSMNAETFPEWRNTTIVADVIRMLDNVLTAFINTAPKYLANAVYSAKQERSLGLGLMGFHSYLQRNMVPFESEAARALNKELFEHMAFQADEESKQLAIERGEPHDMRGTGRRNAHKLALAPNANSGIILNTSPATENNAANAFAHEARVGVYLVKNVFLEKLLEEKGMNTAEVWQDIITAKGSVQHLDFLTDYEKSVFRTANETSKFWVIKHAADRQPFICQSQSVNLFYASGENREKFNKIHMMAWKLGLKSLYYCRATSSNRAEDVSKKVNRVALNDADYNQEDNTSEECVACQG